MRDIHADVTGPWIGDLNATLYDHERDGPPLLHPLMHEQGLIQAINKCELIDSGFVGDPFTWERDGIKKLLDRMLVNISWRLRFTKAEVHHLPFFKFDHRPLLVRFENHPSSNRHRRPFWFETA